MTPYELRLHILNFNEKLKTDQEEKMVLAYLGAYWNRVKKMPSLNEILNKNQPKKTQTDEEMLKVVHSLNTMFGGEVVKGGEAVGSSEEFNGASRG
jgi:hypothetical protein